MKTKIGQVEQEFPYSFPLKIDPANTPTDKLEELFNKQRVLQAKLGNTQIIGNQQFINTMTLALTDELFEALRETPWKPWKKQQVFNQENFQKELVDAWHFLINLTLASGMTSQMLYDEFVKKNNENHERKNTGY